jgi:hypothetical protein
VVIAHRGTDIKNIVAIVTDVKNVLFNNYVSQMSSASTFANNVVAILQEREQENKFCFEQFFYRSVLRRLAGADHCLYD